MTKKKALCYWFMISLLLPHPVMADTDKEVLVQIKRMKNAEDPSTLDAARALVELGDKTLEALKDKDDQVRVSVSWALARMGHKPALPYFIQILQDGKEPYEVCVNAAWGLGKIGDTSAIPVLVKALGNESDLDSTSAVRREAQDSLTTFGKAAIPYLMSALEEKRLEPVGSRMRDRVIHSITIVLGRVKDISVAPKLYTILADEDPAVSMYGAEALCNMGEEAVIYDLIKYAMQQGKVALNKAMQEKAITDESDINEVLSVFSQNRMLSSIGFAFENVGEPMVPFLMKALNHNDWEIRLFAVSALAAFTGSYPAYRKQIIEALILKLNDERRQVRGIARECLLRITGQDCGTEITKWQEWFAQNKASL